MSGHVTPHGRFPARSLRPSTAAGRGHIKARRGFDHIGPRNATVPNAGSARRNLPHAEPKRTADYKIRSEGRKHKYEAIQSSNNGVLCSCLLYTSDAADDLLCVDLG